VTIGRLASGELLARRLVRESDGVLRLLERSPVGGTRRHELAELLTAGWRIVDVSSAEQALLDAHGFGDWNVSDRSDATDDKDA
jgi:hypothetical protein